MTKTCSRCKEEKPKSEFSKNILSTDGLRPNCKMCANKAYHKYHKQNRQKICESQREYREQNRQKIHDHLLHRDYGISIDDYDRMSVIQGHKCAICGSQNPGTNRNHFCVDHDHITGEIRALLCCKCNQGLGYFNDDLGLLEKATEYLRVFQKAE